MAVPLLFFIQLNDMRVSITICTILLLILSCSGNKLVRSVEKFLGQQISLSSDWNAIVRGRDAVLADFTSAPVKLVIWYDSRSCTSCEVSNMYEWEDITAYANSLAEWLSIIYLFTPKEVDLYVTSITLKGTKFDYPVFIDQNGTFVKQNPKLPKNRQLHSFLLDKNNRVVMVGNPLHNPTLWALYKSTIQKMIDNGGVLPNS